ncbi:conserved hypothetical protein [Hyphomicrobiales bacterium]|nr:conserved hypothetical protein [Hyphomicrobiales bacterium]CAH1701493.1 conserved hypothetical protein [Hyphomicrobiales bacterium]CAI0345450.1 conserved hypothetical protein [Hyphomicrobiales bacterium]
MKTLELNLVSHSGSSRLAATIDELVIGGWAGRDKAAMEHHMAELEALGVKRPTSTPVYYRVAAARLTTAPVIEDVGANSSGEVEAILLSSGGRTYVGVGSDHTDRQVETYGISVSKQVCDKPVADTVWPYEEVAGHWDSLILRSYAVIDGERRKYQEGPISGLLAPADLIRGFSESGELPEGTALFGGTMPAIGGIQMASRFEGELEDPVLKRSIRFGYDLKILPIRG